MAGSRPLTRVPNIAICAPFLRRRRGWDDHAKVPPEWQQTNRNQLEGAESQTQEQPETYTCSPAGNLSSNSIDSAFSNVVTVSYW